MYKTEINRPPDIENKLTVTKGKRFKGEINQEFEIKTPVHSTTYEIHTRKFHGSPVLRIPHSHCPGPQFNPWSVN